MDEIELRKRIDELNNNLKNLNIQLEKSSKTSSKLQRWLIFFGLL